MNIHDFGRAEDRLHAALTSGLAGDGLAYQHFLRQLAAHLRAYFRRRMAALPNDVEDLVQETLLAIHHQRHTYKPAQPLTAWVHAIARYKLIDLLRRRSGAEALTDPLEDEDSLFGSSDLEAAEARRDLHRLLASLPARMRQAIELVKLDGLSVAEAALRCGQSESAVKVNIHRGIKNLAARIGKHHDEDR
jgi:RNA polymerase sigma-70 factor, ECF subfamily